MINDKNNMMNIRIFIVPGKRQEEGSLLAVKWRHWFSEELNTFVRFSLRNNKDKQVKNFRQMLILLLLLFQFNTYNFNGPPNLFKLCLNKLLGGIFFSVRVCKRVKSSWQKHDKHWFQLGWQGQGRGKSITIALVLVFTLGW